MLLHVLRDDSASWLSFLTDFLHLTLAHRTKSDFIYWGRAVCNVTAQYASPDTG